MKRLKKGFTIVELVIVIAVIAILASVLIPVFSNIVDKAKVNADTQVVRNMNTALATDEAINGKAEDFGEIVSILKEDGYILANLNPTTKGWFYVWESNANRILLVDNKYDVQFPKEFKDDNPSSTWYFAVNNQATADKVKADNPSVNVKFSITNLSSLNAALTSGGEKTIYIDENIVIDKNNTVSVNSADAKITLNLGSAVVSGDNDDSLGIENIPFLLEQGELSIIGGKLSTTGNMLDADGNLINTTIMASGGKLSVEDCEIKTTGSRIPVALESTQASFKNVKITASNNIIGAYNGSNVVVEDCEIEAEYLAFFSSNSGGTTSKITIDGGNYHTTTSNLLGVHGGEIVVKDGEFACDNAPKTFKFYNVEGSKIIIEGGTFNGVAFADLTATMLDGWVNKSDIGSSTISITFENNAWVIALVK